MHHVGYITVVVVQEGMAARDAVLSKVCGMTPCSTLEGVDRGHVQGVASVAGCQHGCE